MDHISGLQLSDATKAVFSSLQNFGEATRKMLAEAIGLSFPTVTVALAELISKAMVYEIRREQGARGRATIVYGVHDKAGWILGVDIGSTQISFVARSLSGKVLDRDTIMHRAKSAGAGKLAGELVHERVAKRARHSPLLAVALALNRVVPRQLFESDGRRTVALDICEAFLVAAAIPAATPVLVENNVNCAAVDEHFDGLMQGHQDAAYMQMGVGIGLGFFADGALIRGGQGAGGELAQIPISWSSNIASPPDAIEQAYGSVGLMKRASELWPEGETFPRSPEELFTFAESGNEIAKRVMQEHSIALGRIAAAAAAVLDPAVLVLGGGLSRNGDFALQVMNEFRARNTSTTVETSRKGPDATVNGAVILARDLALRCLVDRHHRPLLNRPTIMPVV